MELLTPVSSPAKVPFHRSHNMAVTFILRAFFHGASRAGPFGRVPSPSVETTEPLIRAAGSVVTRRGGGRLPLPESDIDTLFNPPPSL